MISALDWAFILGIPLIIFMNLVKLVSLIQILLAISEKTLINFQLPLKSESIY